MTRNGESPDTYGGGHNALLYGSVDEYVDAITSFVGAGEPALVAVPYPKKELLHEILGARTRVSFVDMADLGRNPARIIPAVRSFVHAQGGRPTRFVGEPTWPGRSAAEMGEVLLHEGLLDIAMAGTAISILCPYDTVALDAAIIADAERVHTHLLDGGRRRESATYDPDMAMALFRRPLPPAPSHAASLVFDHDLSRLRHFVEEGAGRTGLADERLQDLLLAVNEVATNAVIHVGTPGLIRFWHDAEAMEVVCDLCDDGRIDQPLVGRFGPYPLAVEGWGLWMVNQVCDLVELRSGDWGTNVRLHVRVP